MESSYQLFVKVLRNLKDGMSISFTKDNLAVGDTFLILGHGRSKCEVSFRKHGCLWWVYFDNAEPMLLENVPESFLKSIIKNL